MHKCLMLRGIRSGRSSFKGFHYWRCKWLKICVAVQPSWASLCFNNRILADQKGPESLCPNSRWAAEDRWSPRPRAPEICNSRCHSIYLVYWSAIYAWQLCVMNCSATRGQMTLIGAVTLTPNEPQTIRFSCWKSRGARRHNGGIFNLVTLCLPLNTNPEMNFHTRIRELLLEGQMNQTLHLWVVTGH